MSRLRRADDAVVRWIDGPRVLRPGRRRSMLLLSLRGWRWLPTCAIYLGASWFVALIVLEAVADPSRRAVAVTACLWLAVASPAIGRPPLSLVRLRVATVVWWTLTILLLPLFGAGFVFAPAALVGLLGYVVSRVVVRCAARRADESGPMSPRRLDRLD